MTHLKLLAVAGLRSITGRTGALLGGAAPGVYVFTAMAATMATGRAGPDQMIGNLFALFFLGAVGAGCGALVGWGLHLLVKRTSFAGPVDSRIVATALAVVVVTAAVVGVQAARRAESQNQPRVIQSTGTVTRLASSGAPAPLTSAAYLLSRGEPAAALEWRGRKTEIALEDQYVIVRQGSVVLDRVSLKGLDDVSRVWGVTATLDGGREWLALLVRLRATGRRELLIIYDPEGALAYQELIARTRTTPLLQPVFWSSGRSGERQEFILDLGEPVRYFVRK